MESYCGKQCEYCVDKAELNCPGCKAVPAAERQRDCEIAACCRSKENNACSACAMSVGCGRQLGRNAIPARRKQKQAEAAARRAELIGRAPVLEKWLIVLFWLVIPYAAAAVLTNDSVVETCPPLRIPGLILRALVMAAYGVILLKLSANERKWRRAGFVFLVDAALSLFVMFLPFSHVGLMVLSSVALLIVTTVGEYFECVGHNRLMLEEGEEALALRWKKVWKGFVAARLCSFAGMSILPVAPMLSLLVSLGSLVALLVMGFRKMCVLRLMIILFREYPAE